MANTPRLPFELIEKILTVAAAELAAEELRAPASAPELAVPFLLTASLVSHTWTTIAQQLLFHYTPVTQNRVHLMAEKLKGRTGAVRRVRVKGCSESSGGSLCLDTLETVLGVLGPLEELIIYGDCDGDHRLLANGYPISKLVLVKQSLQHSLDILSSLERSGIANVSVVDASSFGPRQLTVAIVSGIQSLFQKLHSISIHGCDSFLNHYYLRWYLPMEATRSTSLESYRFASGDHYGCILIREASDSTPPIWAHIQKLNHLAVHLFLLPRTSVGHSLPSSLRILEVVPDPDPPAGTPSVSADLDHEGALLKSLHDVLALESLSVPAVWRSDKVEEACERRGIALSWT